jgi:hypothetical protein
VDGELSVVAVRFLVSLLLLGRQLLSLLQLPLMVAFIVVVFPSSLLHR